MSMLGVHVTRSVDEFIRAVSEDQGQGQGQGQGQDQGLAGSGSGSEASVGKEGVVVLGRRPSALKPMYLSLFPDSTRFVNSEWLYMSCCGGRPVDPEPFEYIRSKQE